jgi:hypothetical protein
MRNARRALVTNEGLATRQLRLSIFDSLGPLTLLLVEEILVACSAGSTAATSRLSRLHAIWQFEPGLAIEFRVVVCGGAVHWVIG